MGRAVWRGPGVGPWEGKWDAQTDWIRTFSNHTSHVAQSGCTSGPDCSQPMHAHTHLGTGHKGAAASLTDTTFRQQSTKTATEAFSAACAIFVHSWGREMHVPGISARASTRMCRLMTHSKNPTATQCGPCRNSPERPCKALKATPTHINMPRHSLTYHHKARKRGRVQAVAQHQPVVFPSTGAKYCTPLCTQPWPAK